MKKYITSFVLMLCSIGMSAHDFEVNGIYYKKLNKFADPNAYGVAVTYRGNAYNTYTDEYTGEVNIPSFVECESDNKTYKVLEIKDEAFRGCSGLTSVTIPNSVTTIGKCSFFLCSGLSSINIPNSVTSIGAEAFGKTGLTSVTLPNNLVEIDHHMFCGCTSLTSVFIPSSVTTISLGAFEDCTSLAAVFVENVNPISIFNSDVFSNKANAILFVPSGSEAAYQAADYWKEFKKIVEISQSSETISFADAYVKALCVQNWDFNGDGEISDYEAAAVTDLGEVFKGNTTITSFDELQCFTGLTTINTQAFNDCTNLTSIVIPANVETIDYMAFSGCSNITSIVIPSNVTYIGDDAFRGTGLTSIDIPDNVTTMKSCCFAGCNNLVSATIGSGVTSYDSSALIDNPSLTSIVVSQENQVYDSRNGCNAVIRKSDNVLLTGCNNTVIPNGITGIFTYAFRGCIGITSVTIPNSVISIGVQAFYNCSGLTSVTIPNSVTSIGNYAFGKTSLNSMTVRWSTPISINSNVFSNNSNTNATLYVPYGTLSAYESASVWSDFHDIVELSSVSFTMNNLGMATFSNSTGLDFTNVQGLKAYIASGFSPSTGKLLLTRVDKVPANEGLVLKGEAGDYEIPFTTTDMYYSNLLVGVPTATTVSPTKGEYTNFILANGKYGVSFYTLSQEGIISDGKAYLQLPTSMLSNLSKGMVMAFDDEQDEATGIKDVESGRMNGNRYYNLNGQRVDKIQRGVYIINGKKILIK